MLLLLVCTTISSCKNLNDSDNSNDFNHKQQHSKSILLNPETLPLLEKYQNVQLLLDSLERAEVDGNSTAAVRLKVKLGDILRGAGNYFESLDLLKSALDSSGYPENSHHFGEINNLLSANYYELYFHNKNHLAYLDSSEKFAAKALKIAKINGDKTLESSTLNILGGINIHRGVNDSAVLLLEKALTLNRMVTSDENLAILHNLAFANYKLNSVDEAIKYANLCLMAASNRSDILFSVLSREILAGIYDTTGDSLLARQMRNEANQIKDKKDIIAQAFMVKQLYLAYQNRQAQKTLHVAYLDQVYFIRLSRILIAFSSVLTVMLLIAIYLFRQNKKLRQADHNLMKAQQLSDELIIKNAELELKIKEAEAKAMKKELDAKDAELASKLMTLTQMNQFLTELKYKVKPNSNNSEKKQPSQQLIEINQEINKYLDNNIWKEFELLYASGNSSFIQLVIEKQPDLTTNEKRLCYLILMDLSSKEISQVLNKSYRSVEMARHRLRTKLSLGQNEKLADYLKQIANM